MSLETGPALDPKNSALLHNINIRLGTQVYGQERPRLLAFCVAASSKTPYPLALILVGDPGAAKSTICKVVMANFDNKIEITSATAKALDYLPEESLANKVLYVDEAIGVRDAGLALRVLLSDGRLARLVTVKDDKTGKYRSEIAYHKGRPVFLSTTTLVKFGVAIANRILFESMDQSPEQIKGALKWLANQSSTPHCEEPQPDSYLTEFLNNSISNKQVLVPFLGPVAEKLPSTKTLIFRRSKQLEYLVKVSALIHWQQRVHVLVLDEEYMVAHPVDFLYARDLLGPGGIGARMDQRLSQVYEYMKITESYRTLDIAKAFDKSQDWARMILDELNNIGLVEKNESTRPYVFTKLEANPETDPLQPDYLEGYGLDGPLFQNWLGEAKALVVYRPETEPVYVNPLDTPRLRQDAIRAQSQPNQPESVMVVPNRLSSVSIKPQSLADETDRVLACPLRCGITFPDQPSLDNHLSTYKHSEVS